MTVDGRWDGTHFQRALERIVIVIMDGNSDIRVDEVHELDACIRSVGFRVKYMVDRRSGKYLVPRPLSP